MTEAAHQDPVPAARPGRSLAVLGLILVCVAAGVGGYVYESNRAPPVVAIQPPQAQPKPVAAKPAPAVQQAQAQQMQPPPAATKPAAPQLAASKPAAPQPKAPSVDVVRVDQYGTLVMAGQAKPGESLTIHSGVTMLGTATADANGQWVFLPDATLPSGVHQLSVADAKAPATDTAAQTTVLLSLPGQAGDTGSPLKSGPMVVLSQGSGPPRLLQAPQGSHPGPVGLDVVQYDDQGRIRFTGHAQPGRTVRLYVDDHDVGDALADTNGLWTLAPASDLPPGIYRLRTDELAASGKVMARSELPFARASLKQVLAPGQAVVQPGDCLWTIARHSYGRGIEYTAIFEENHDQIRDPRRIYPGQAFHMPTADEAAHAPPLSAVERAIRSEHRTSLRHIERRHGGETSRG
jgi:nucleoid-associated protein YgaU